ncbi:c-type cytochrome [Roseisolibacter agri]|uniref:Cytochrome c n=1 Tax=Roseisolibacter agri TaxID=2014610 RepID=A0AA37Q7R9_9BACT|nr:c-type cytochrome [Roseisolibacter agri]GLC23916.1 cytochrome c [Roseisolibacter agri]
MRRATRAALLLALVAAGACDREKRDFQTIPPGASDETLVRTSALHAGPPVPEPTAGTYQDNAWAIGEGQRLYNQMNCSGCHAPGGGGGIGPALSDDEWIYGSEPENVFDTIVKGRPHGMPSYRGRMGNSEVWKLVAYVRTLGGLTRKDAWSPRGEHLGESTPDPNTRGHGLDDSSRVHPEQLPPAPPGGGD